MKTIKYKIDSCIIHSEKNVYDSGCELSNNSQFAELKINENSLSELLAELKRQVNYLDDELLLNSCDEIGRLDIQWHSLKPFNFNRINKHSIEKWKAGDIDVYLNNLSVHIEKVITESVDLVDEVKREKLYKSEFKKYQEIMR